MATEQVEGYDAPRGSRQDDQLDRWRFATDVVQVIVNTPIDWSVRVGVFGEWGEGKSTVLRFSERMLKDQGHLVFWFNPWAAQSWDDLWGEFEDRMYGALAAHGIAVETQLRGKARWISSLFRKNEKTAEAMAGASAVSKAVYSVAIQALRKWLDPNGPQLKRIREHLGKKRLVVLIDDLDRSDPKLVPQLLLSLRELMDLPGFTFVLAFDEKIVGSALKEYHSSWDEGGGSFLDKILDFRFHLPPISPEQTLGLLRAALTRFCPFVPDASISEIEDLLPANPRKLKSLVRNLSVLRGEIERHDANEVNWVDIWLAHLIQLESQPFFEDLLLPGVIEKESGPVYQVLNGLSARERDKQDPHATVNERLDRCGVKNPANRARLLKLMEGLRNRASMELRYNAQLTLRPHRITGKEFREILDQWHSSKRSEDVRVWINSQAQAQGASQADVEQELFDCTLKNRERRLSEASDTFALAENEAAVQKGLDLLNFIRCLVVDLNLQTAQRSGQILGQALHWVHFRTNAPDARARKEERVLVLELFNVNSRFLDPIAYLNVLSPWDYSNHDGGIDARSYELRKELRGACLASILGPASQATLQLFRTPDAIRKLNENGRYIPQKYCLLSNESPLWRPDVSTALVDIVREGCTDDVIRDNCREFFHLIRRGWMSSLDYFGKDDCELILKNEGFISELWRTVTSQPIQFRMQGDYVEAHRLLISLGIAEALVPLTPELADRQAMGE